MKLHGADEIPGSGIKITVFGAVTPCGIRQLPNDPMPYTRSLLYLGSVCFSGHLEISALWANPISFTPSRTISLWPVLILSSTVDLSCNKRRKEAEEHHQVSNNTSYNTQFTRFPLQSRGLIFILHDWLKFRTEDEFYVKELLWYRTFGASLLPLTLQPLVGSGLLH